MELGGVVRLGRGTHGLLDSRHVVWRQFGPAADGNLALGHNFDRQQLLGARSLGALLPVGPSALPYARNICCSHLRDTEPFTPRPEPLIRPHTVTIAIVIVRATNKRLGDSDNRMIYAQSMTKALSTAANGAARRYVRRILTDDFKGNYTRAAKTLGISYGMLYDFLDEKRGAGLKLLDAVVAYERKQGRLTTVDIVLGRAPALGPVAGTASAYGPLVARAVILADIAVIYPWDQAMPVADRGQAIRSVWAWLKDADVKDSEPEIRAAIMKRLISLIERPLLEQSAAIPPLPTPLLLGPGQAERAADGTPRKRSRRHGG